MKILLAVAMVLTPAQPSALTAAEIDRATDVIASRVTTPGTAHGWDPAARRVIVTVDSTVRGRALESVEAAVRDAGRAARLERIPGKLRILVAGGDGINSGQGRCSVGANAHRGRTYFIITAGHCTESGGTWYFGSTVIGSVAASNFPGDDYGLIHYANSALQHPSAVNTYPGLRFISGPGTPHVGQWVCRSGSTTGLHCGYITGLNATVMFPGGAVFGLIRTNICAEPGDSGGTLFDPETGKVLGILVGGSGNCTVGGTTYYQPIMEILYRYGLTIP